MLPDIYPITAPNIEPTKEPAYNLSTPAFEYPYAAPIAMPATEPIAIPISAAPPTKNPRATETSTIATVPISNCALIER